MSIERGPLAEHKYGLDANGDRVCIDGRCLISMAVGTRRSATDVKPGGMVAAGRAAGAGLGARLSARPWPSAMHSTPSTTTQHGLADLNVRHPTWGMRAIRRYLESSPGYPEVTLTGGLDERLVQSFA